MGAAIRPHVGIATHAPVRGTDPPAPKRWAETCVPTADVVAEDVLSNGLRAALSNLSDARLSRAEGIAKSVASRLVTRFSVCPTHAERRVDIVRTATTFFTAVSHRRNGGASFRTHLACNRTMVSISRRHIGAEHIRLDDIPF